MIALIELSNRTEGSLQFFLRGVKIAQRPFLRQDLKIGMLGELHEDILQIFDRKLLLLLEPSDDSPYFLIDFIKRGAPEILDCLPPDRCRIGHKFDLKKNARLKCIFAQHPLAKSVNRKYRSFVKGKKRVF